jgi:threonine dehydratase
MTLGLEDVRAARDRIRSDVVVTPLERARWLDHPGTRVWLKLECFQRTGSFKARGAFAKLRALDSEQRRGGILTVSAGNHGLGVAEAAFELAISATVVVPKNAAPTKVRAIRERGAVLIEAGENYDQAERAGRAMAEERGLVFVSAYNDREVIAGQGTIALEVLEQHPGLDACLAPVGGGGLLAGIAIAAPSLRSIGAEPEASPTMTAALAKNEIVPIEERPTLADGLAGNIELGSITFEPIRDRVSEIVLVSEAEIGAAIVEAARHAHLMLEGSAAVAIAAVQKAGPLGDVAVVVTGRNIDLDRFLALMN